MNFQTLKDYFQEFIECNQHKIMFLNRKDDIFEEFKVIDAINFLEEKDKEIERLNNDIKELFKENSNKGKVIKAQDNIIKEVREYIDYYGITPEQNDDVMVRRILKGILKILDKVENK